MSDIMNATTRCFEIRGFQAPLALESRPLPAPASDEVVVKINSTSLNYRDILVREGRYNPRFALPLVPLSDGAGEVVSLGKNVRQWAEGDRVTLTYMEGWPDGPLTDRVRRATLGGPVDGVLTQMRLVSVGDLVATPKGMTDAEAACFPCAGVTAWTALVDHCRVMAGDWVLVQGTGGVSLFALQFAKAMGALVAVISSSDEKLEVARRMGADHTLNYRETPDWSKAILKDVGPMQHVIEVGGGETLSHSLRVVATAGNVALIGVLSGVEVSLAVTSILMRGIKIHGVAVGSKRSMEDMFRAVAAHGLRPVIDRSVGFHEAENAYLGKVVIEGFHD